MFSMVMRLERHENPDMHSCESRRDGDWIIFTCPKCEGFERRLNYVTGEFKFQPNENPYVLHEGSFQPVGFEVEGSGVN